MEELDLRVNLAPRGKQDLILKNPVLCASGTCGYGEELHRLFDVGRLGGIVSKGITLRPRSGNPPPRIWETPAGMLNAIGLQNPGVEAVLERYAPLWARWDTAVLVNINGETLDEYVALAARLDGVEGVDGIELNLSCPNVRAGGMHFGTDPKMVAAVTRAVRAATTLPLVVKLSPNVTEIVPLAEAAVAAGADALSLINTLLGMAIDVERRRPALAFGTGGLSGPAIRPVAVRMVYQVAKADLGVPIVGIGGITSARDALEFLMAGASAVQVGTATFRNPWAPLEVLEGLVVWMEREGVRRLEEVVGAAL